MPETILELANVTKTFKGKTAVNDVSFSVERGQITGFLGPNGAGKTTSLRMSLGILTPDRGKVSLFGTRPGAKALDRVGFLPEERGIYRRMKVIDVIVFFARLKGVEAGEAKKRGLKMLDEFDLLEASEQQVKTLSKGMAQKVQIISTLIHEPEFIILDEPFSGLDPVNQKSLERIVRAQADAGRTILFSTHVMEHAERLCDKILLIANGTKIFDGSVKQALGEVPRRIFLETESEHDLLALLDAHGDVRRDDTGNDGTRCWTLDLAPGANAQDVLKACVDADVRLTRFEPVRAHLHDAFVHLVETAGQTLKETTDA